MKLTMKTITDYAAGFLLLLAGICSCEPDTVPVKFKDEGASDTKTVALHLDGAEMMQTRSSLGSGIESLFTGAVLAVYDSGTGVMEAEIEIPADMFGKTMLVRLPQGRTYDMFLIGNLRMLADDGTARFPVMPASSEEIQDFSYRLDGADAGDGLRRESFSDVADWGIPLCWSRKSLDPLKDASVDVEMERLFSKVVLTVDHSGIAGTDLESFINESVHIKQSNCVLRPFSEEGSRAADVGDVISVSDHEVSMKNGLSEEFVFYVPENRQGVLMPGNTDPAEKDIEGVEAACGEGISKLLTYLEFKGRLNAGDKGLEGDILYRFFLGRNSTDDFDIGRNREIRVTLSFNSESVFEPDWKLDNEDFTDSRRFFLSGDLAGALPEGKEIYVRKNRPGTFNLNITAGDGGPNIIGSAVLTAADHEPGYLTELAWTSDFWAAGHEAADEPQRARLRELGIEVQYSDGRFTFSVTDPARFVSGMRIPLTLRLMPGDIETGAVIVTGPDISVTEDNGLSLDEGFFVGQKRLLRFSGFAGKRIYYLADQDATDGSVGNHDRNVHWKVRNEDSAPFAGCHLDASGNVIYPYQDYDLYDDQCVNVLGRLNVCAFFPNTYRVYPYRYSPGKIVICSEDIHNDGLFEIPLEIDLPYYDLHYLLNTYHLPFDGKESELGIRYLTGATGEEIEYSEFDPELFDLLLRPEIVWTSSNNEWQECVEVSDDLKTIYLARTTTSDGKKIEDYIRGRNNVGSMKISPNSRIEDFYYLPTNVMNLACYVHVPEEIGEFRQTDGFRYFNTADMDSKIVYAADCEYDHGDPDYVRLSVDGQGVTFRTKSSPSEEFGPRTEIVHEEGEVRFIFRESEQVKRASNGEVVPGGLLVPYGEHHVRMSVTNRWDGRTLVSERDFTISYNVSLHQFAICRPQRFATIYLVGPKNAQYLSLYGSGADWSTVEFMFGILGDDPWNSHLCASMDSYLFDDVYHQGPGKIYYGPPADFDVKYYMEGEYMWLESIMEKMLRDIAEPDDVTIWLRGLRFHKNGVVSDELYTNDVDISGSTYLTINPLNDIAGAVYRNSLVD